MRCAVCQTPVQLMMHRFYEGVSPKGRTHGERAKREWTIVAPMYFKANADNTEMLEGYCGPKCALTGMIK